MILYTTEEFKIAKDTDLLKMECDECHDIFYVTKAFARKKGKHPKRFCSHECMINNKTKKIPYKCDCCGKEILITPFLNKKFKRHFCSSSCAATYNNKNKTYGTRRSKLEYWLESKLTLLYPNLIFLFNDKIAINSELDIYIPSLKLAFELNGICHYEPIYGETKLSQIKNNDKNKFQLCVENKISLCTIDTSSQKYFKEKTSEPFLNAIKNIIDSNLK